MQLEARILLAERRPQILCLNETFLDASVGEVCIADFVLIARRDRDSEKGGVCVYAASEIAEQVTLMKKSESAEGVWCVVHSDRGPYLLGAWYRPPSTEQDTIETCEREYE